MKKQVVALCVMGLLMCGYNMAFANYKNNGDNTMLDTETGLTWRVAGTYGFYSKENADEYITILNSVDLCKVWRLPSYEEIDGISGYISERPYNNTDDIYWVDTEGEPVTCAYWLNHPDIYVVDRARIWAVHDLIEEDQNQPIQEDQNQIDIKNDVQSDKKNKASKDTGCFIQSIIGRQPFAMLSSHRH
jgi:hypothetical protein